MIAQQTDKWNGRGSLQNLVGELQRQRESRIDFVADTRQLRLVSPLDDAKRQPMRLVPNAPQVAEWLPKEGVTINDHALSQIGEIASPSLPVKYLRELAGARPEIAAQLINQTATAKRRFIRVLDGRVRAFLSDTYRVMDHYDLAFAALDIADKVGARVLECSLSDSHMRMKLVTDSIWRKIDTAQQSGGGAHEWVTGDDADPKYRDATDYAGNGDPMEGGRGTVCPVVTISNSETGQGGLNIRLGIFEKYCLNTSLIESGIRQIHLGSRLEEGVFTAETRAADSNAMSLACRDVIAGAFSVEGFDRIVAKAQKAQSTSILAPTAAVAQLVEMKLVPEARREALLERFLRNYDSTAWGLAQAVSRIAQEFESGDDAAEIENVAGAIVADPGKFAKATA
jgi:hypothetical protein